MRGGLALFKIAKHLLANKSLLLCEESRRESYTEDNNSPVGRGGCIPRPIKIEWK